jgi:BEN domain
MAEENLNLKLRDGQVRNVKRRRISKDVDDDSSLSGWSGVSQSINTERVMSPSSNLQQKRVEQQRYIPPMLFDQGTQTDKRMTSEAGGLQDQIHELQKLIELNEHVLSEQKLLKNEAKMSRLLVESFSDEFSTMRKSMQSIENKVERFIQDYSQLDKVDIVAATSGTKKKILNGSGTAPFFIIEHQEGNASENASLSLNGSNLEYTVEEIEGDDSGRSASRMSYHDQTSMMSNTSIDFKKEPFRRSHSSSNFSINSTSSTPIARSSSNSNLIDEWAEAEGDVMIGSNKTMVPVHVLRAIDWKNYKTATRKLLITLFTRETLATRSLTGRPSPAFHDRNKPVKGKLDQNIINDIIQIVTRKCSVQESQVRTAITTKCADENKMLRNRKDNEEKEKFKTPTSKTPIDNKENVVEN